MERMEIVVREKGTKKEQKKTSSLCFFVVDSLRRRNGLIMISEAVATFPFSQPYPKPQQAEPERVAPLSQFDCFIGVSAHLVELKEFISVQAAALQPVLLIGERGLRQEQIARALHLASEHRGQPFFAINATALDEDALNQLIFGPRGIRENMRRGAIFVNELTGAPPLLQQRFATYIEEQLWSERSGRRPAQRLIFASEYNPTSGNAENRLAHGLIDQLRSSTFLLKPLRERSEDLPYLINHLASRIASRLGKGKLEITNEAMRILVEYEWERNIDELESVIKRHARQRASTAHWRTSVARSDPLYVVTNDPANRH